MSKIFSFSYQDKWFVVEVDKTHFEDFLKFYRKNRLEPFTSNEKDAPITYLKFTEETSNECR